jgi:hypothetical protein
MASSATSRERTIDDDDDDETMTAHHEIKRSSLGPFFC